jgi:hypothetical protein
MEQPKGLIQDRNGKFVYMLENSLYDLFVPTQIYKRFKSFIVSQIFSKGRNDYTFYSTFTVLMLIVDDMLDASQSVEKISRKMTQVDRRIQMRDQGETKQIMGMEVYIDGNDSNVTVKWVFRHLRRKNFTYNGYTQMLCDNCNVYCNTCGLDTRRSITKYFSLRNCGKHVGGGITPQEIQNRAS